MNQRNAWVVLACGALIVTLAMGVRQSFGLFMRPVTGELGFGRESFAFAIALQNLMWGAAQPWVGMLADRHGATRVVIGGGLIYLAGLLLTSISTGALTIALSLGLMVGLAQSGTTHTVILGAVGRATPPERRSLAFGISTAAGSLGMFAIAPLAAVLLIDMPWQTVLALLGGFGVVMAVAALGLRCGDAPGSRTPMAPGEAKAALREALGTRGYQLLTLGYFVCGFQVAFIGTHLPVYLNDAGLPLTIGATALALIGLFNAFGSFGFGALGGRWSKKYLLSFLYIARAVVIAIFLAVPVTETSALVFASVIGLLWLATVPLTTGLVGQIFGVRHLSMLGGFVFFSHQIGSFLGVWLGGRIYDATGSYNGVWWGAIALGLFAALVHLPIVERPLPRPAHA